MTGIAVLLHTAAGTGVDWMLAAMLTFWAAVGVILVWRAIASLRVGRR